MRALLTQFLTICLVLEEASVHQLFVTALTVHDVLPPAETSFDVVISPPVNYGSIQMMTHFRANHTGGTWPQPLYDLLVIDATDLSCPKHQRTDRTFIPPLSIKCLFISRELIYFFNTGTPTAYSSLRLQSLTYPKGLSRLSQSSLS